MGTDFSFGDDTMDALINFKRRNKASFFDWNYETTTKCTFVFDLPHSALNYKSFKNAWGCLYPILDAQGEEKVALDIAEKYAWDGASCVPDFKGALEGSLPHDFVYQFVEAIAKALGLSIQKVLAVADLMFDQTMQRFGAKPIVRKTYYFAVSKVGYAFNRINAWRNRQ